MSDDENAPSLHEQLVAGLIQLQASFVLTPEFTWHSAIQQIEFEAVKICERFEAEFGESREVAGLVKRLLEGTEFEGLGLLAGIKALRQDWVDTNREITILASARDGLRQSLAEVNGVVNEFNLPGDVTLDRVIELARRYREAYPKVIMLDSQNAGLSRELAEARARTTELEQERSEWERAAEAEFQGRAVDNRLLNELLDQMEPGAYRDSLEERLANPLRQRLGQPRRFEHVPAPDCKKVQTQSGATYLREGSKWVCTFAPSGNGESREQTGASWSQSELREFAPFFEVLDAEQRSDS